MSDISITAANVVVGTGASVRDGTAGASITAGQAVYADASASNVIKLADTSTSAKAACVGIALHAAASGQPIKYCTGGLLTIGATVAVGVPYFVSDNAGGLRPLADAGTGDYATFVAVGMTTSTVYVNPIATGAQIA